MRQTLVAAWLISVAAAATARAAPERLDGWVITPDPPRPRAGCSMAKGDARGRLLVMSAEGRTRMEASSSLWLSSSPFDPRVRLTIDASAPFDMAVQNAGPDGIDLPTDAAPPAPALAERLKTAATLAIRRENDEAAKTVTFDVSGFGPALTRLENCAAGAEAGAAQAMSARRARCEAVAVAAASVIGGRRSADPADDGIAIEASGVRSLVMCGTSDEMPSIAVSGDGHGISAAMLSATGKLAAVLAGHSAEALSTLPARCLARVRRYELRRGGRRTHFPEGTTAMFEGEVTSPPITLTCRYYDVGRVEPSFVLGRK